jgi:hypothetical protein
VMKETGVGNIPNANIEHALQGLMMSIQSRNPNKKITEIVKITFQDPYIDYDESEIGAENLPSLQHVEALVKNIVLGLPKL